MNMAKKVNWREYNEELVNRGRLLARQLFENSQIVVVKTKDGKGFDVFISDAPMNPDDCQKLARRRRRAAT